MKKYSDEEIMQFIDRAPQLVQERITSLATAREIVALGKSKNLHIDQIGKIAELNRNMLLGLMNPQEFLDELIAAGIEEKDAREIIMSVNQKIFMPLHEEIRGGAMGILQPTKIATEPSRPMPIAPPISGMPKPMMTQAPRPTGTLGDIVRSVTAPKLLEDHEEPHIEFAQTPAAPQVSAMPQVAPVAPAPQTLPGAMPEVQLPPPAPRVEPPKYTPPAIPLSSVKSYASDPYREPVDEK